MNFPSEQESMIMLSFLLLNLNKFGDYQEFSNKLLYIIDHFLH